MNYDHQINNLIKNKYFDLSKKNIDLVYCSHFLEHIDDETAKNIFLHSFKALKRGGIFRIVVPDQNYFINLYKAKNKKKLQENIGALNLKTWKIYKTNPESLEQLLAASIGSINNSNHELTIFKHQENLKSRPPVAHQEVCMKD